MTAAEVLLYKNKSALEIHREALRVSKNIQTDYLKLFEILLLVESQQIYYQFEVTSLHLYCVELLELSKHVANDFINVVRKAIEVPELSQSIRTKGLTISKARKICSVLNKTNYQEWIDLATNCSCRIVEKAVAMANPKVAAVESIKYVSSDVLEFRMGVSEEWSELLEKTKDLLSQKKSRNVTSEEAIFILMKKYCQKQDPVEKAKRALKKEKRDPNPKQAQVIPSKIPSRYRSARVEHVVDLRDQNQCTYIDIRRKRCASKRWLNKHHIRAFAKGGDHSPVNLETLCWGHHKIKHLNSAEHLKTHDFRAISKQS